MLRLRLNAAFVSLLSVAAIAEPARAADPYIVVVRPYYQGYWGSVGDVINAQGRYLISEKQAKLLGEQVKQEKFVTERKKLEQWDWSRKFVARSNESYRQEVRARQLRKIVDDPAPEDIYNGSALNRLLDEMLKMSRNSPSGKSEEVNAEWLEHIHVTSTENKVGADGHPGLLKMSKVRWPLEVEARSDLTRDRAEVEKMLGQARTAVLKGDRPAKELVALRSQLDQLHDRFRSELNAGGFRWGMAPYIRAQGTVHDLQEAVDLLDRVDAAKYLRPLRGTTVAEVVNNVTGLKFTRAMAGDEPYYSKLYVAFRNELYRLGWLPIVPTGP